MESEGRESLNYCYSSIMNNIVMKKTNFDKNQNMFQVDIDSVNKTGFNGNHIVRTLRCQVFKFPLFSFTQVRHFILVSFVIFPCLSKYGSEGDLLD